jgi:hypothetical protein
MPTSFPAPGPVRAAPRRGNQPYACGDFIVKFCVFYTQAGKARLQNSTATFGLFDYISRTQEKIYGAFWI